MNCFCGCGAKVRRNQTDLNLQASLVALELLAWDKARAAGHLGPPASDDAERVIEDGAGCYQRLILTLHGEPSDYSLDEGKSWLTRSAGERRDREYMTAKGRFFAADKLPLTEEDMERLDRNRPELSFSRRKEADGDADRVVDQLERLGALHAEGVLTEAEFAAGKARILGLG